MTYPLGPIAAPDLAGMVQTTTPDAAILRIGRVTSYAAGTITVNISDSDVLVDATYIFGAYQPVLGDNVAVLKQGNQWLALGIPSANPDDNPIQNYSFEDGEYEVMAPSWTLYHDPASTDTASLDVASAEPPIDGPKCLRIGIGLPPGPLTASEDFVSSEPFPVTPGDFWSAQAWIMGDSASGPPWVRGSAACFFAWYNNPGNTYPNTAAADSGFAPINVPMTAPWVLVRSESGSAKGVEVPAGVTHARVTLWTVLTHEDTTADYSMAVYWDRVIARKLP